MQLTEAFERVYILNLPFKQDRKARLRAHLNALNLVNWDHVEWPRTICGDWCPPPAWFGSGKGAWGCLQSHARILQDAIHDGLESYLVLEDDVIFTEKTDALLEEFMNVVPKDWTQIYLGGQHLHKGPQAVAPGVVRPHNVNRTHAFAASKKWMPKILQHILHTPDYLKADWDPASLKIHLAPNKHHVDHQLGRAHERKDWPVYCPEWWMAGQDEGPSNISGKTNPRQWWFCWELWDRLPLVHIPSGITADKLPRDLIHVGNNPVGGTLTDQGLLDCFKGDEGQFFRFLKLIADEALKLGRLPGVQFPLGAALDLGVWPAGVVALDQAEGYRYV